MEQAKKQIKLLNFSFICLIVAIVVVSIGFATILKNHNQELLEKDQKISNLVQEVGQLKADMDLSYVAITTASEEIEKIHASVNDAIKTKNISLENIKKDVGRTQKTLVSALTKQDDALKKVLRQKDDLKNELDLVPILNDSTQNFLILGQNKGLVDTIIVAIVVPEKRKITLISVPRDLSYQGRKLSELYNTYGLSELKRAITDITGLRAEKYALFDFDSFVEIVDTLEGVEIDVPKAINDNAYPGPNNSYKVVKFDAGTQKLDGTRALQYVRSRKSTSDYDRSKRQQQMIESIKQKALEINLLGRMDLALKLYATIQEGTETNISLFEGLGYFQAYQNYQINKDNVLSSDSLLYETKNRRGQFILLPQSGSFTELHSHIAKLIGK